MAMLHRSSEELIRLVARETLKGLLRDPASAAIPANAAGFVACLRSAARAGHDTPEGAEAVAALRLQLRKLNGFVREMALNAALAWRPQEPDGLCWRDELLSLLSDPVNAIVPLKARSIFSQLQEIRALGAGSPKGSELLEALKRQLTILPPERLARLKKSAAAWQPANEIDRIQLAELLEFLDPETLPNAALRPLAELQAGAVKAALQDIF